MEFVPLVKNILILDSKGGRVAVKYYTHEWPTVREQKELEKAIFKKARKTMLLEGRDQGMVFGKNLILYTFSDDLCFFVTGSEDENDLILAEVLDKFYNAVDELAGDHVHFHCVDKDFVLQNLTSVVLLLDGFIDRGIILETDGEAILRV